MTMIDDLATIKARVDCRDLLASYGVRFAPGATGNAHCWHSTNHKNGDRSASVQVFADGFKCHGCHQSGSVFDVVMHFEGVDFKQALKLLSKREGVELTGRRVQATARDFADLTTPNIPDVRREILGRVWDCIVFAEQPARLFEYGAARGIDEQTMRIAGVRDWTAAVDDVAAVLNDYTKADWIAAGVGRMVVDEKSGTEKFVRWQPFAELREIRQGIKRRASGFIVPVFDGTDSAPVAFRWRYYRPGKIKARGQPSGSPILPLGLDSLTRARAGNEPYIVIVCEGETDWLAAMDAARVAGVQAAVLAHCTMGTRWRAEWSEMMSDADWIVVAFDEGKGNYPAGRARADEIMAQRTSDRMTINLTAEGGLDLADRHKQGMLAPLIQRWAAIAAQTSHNLTIEAVAQ